MSFFDVLGSIFEKWPMTDLTNVIVSMCLVSYNFCMIPHVLTVTFGLNLSGAWGDLTLRNLSSKIFAKWVLVSGLICEDLKTACQVNYRLTHCDKCQFIIVL